MRKQTVRKKKGMMTLEQKKARWGYLFVLPLCFGLIFQFGIPAVNSLRFAFSNVQVSSEGYTLTFCNLQNFSDALLVNAKCDGNSVIDKVNMLKQKHTS